jgi:DNA-binding NarL/FixJ family response regulator
MNSYPVLLVDDNDEYRSAIARGLRKQGIDIVEANSPEQARAVLLTTPDPAVVILDVVFDDENKQPLAENGFAFGLRLKSERERPPEFLIHSGHEDIDYFQAALKLGAAAYVGKTETAESGLSQVDVIAGHVRALALRRALQDPAMALSLHDIVIHSDSLDEAIVRFSRDVLAKELQGTVGGNFILLLTRGDEVAAVTGTDVALRTSDRALLQLQGAVHARLSNTEPYVVSARKVWAPNQEHEELQRLLESLSGAAFADLGEVHSARLSVGLIPRSRADVEAVKEQVKLLDRYFQKPLMLQLTAILTEWTKLDLKRRLEIHKREVLLDATGKFCLYEAEELTYALRDSDADEDGTPASVKVEKLKAIADELRQAGEVLGYFAHGLPADVPEKASDVAAIVEEVWSDEIALEYRLAQPTLRIVGHCETSDLRDRAARTVAQILDWMARRLSREEVTDDRTLWVECRTDTGNRRVQVIFEEHSTKRIPPRLRAWSFEPFYGGFAHEPSDARADGRRRLGLYLAKTLAGLAGGALEDRSDELDGTLGHRFVLELPASGLSPVA